MTHTIVINPSKDERDAMGRCIDLFAYETELKLFRVYPHGNTWYWNQFDDCSCRQGYMKGTALPVHEPDKELMGLMYSLYGSEEAYSRHTRELFGYECIRVYGQGIILLADESLLVAEGTD